MRELSPHARIYVVLVIISGYLALGELMSRSTSPPMTKLLVLLLLAITCGPLQIRLPRLSTRQSGEQPEAISVSLALLFVFSALVELPARYAALVSMAAVASQLQFGARTKPKLREYLFLLSAANLSLLLSYDAYHELLGRRHVGVAWALAVAAALHFLISTWSRAAAISLERGWPVSRTWWRDFLPSAPLYGLLAAGGSLFGLLFDPSQLRTLILTFPVICLVYYCYEFYFGRLRAERRYAKEMAEVYRRAVEALALAINAKDRATSGHLCRVQRYALEIGRRMGCSTSEIKALEVGSLLHDIGKIAVPEHLLLKPGKLTRQEFNQIAVHPQVGAEILAAVNFPFPVAELVHSHHENWDGSGYPRRLKGVEIPLTARILSVADCFDALLSDRPYRPAFPVEKAVEMLETRRGTTFDPQVVDTLLALLPVLPAQPPEETPAEKLRFSLQSPRAIEAVQTSWTVEEQALGASAAGRALPAAESLRQLLEAARGTQSAGEISHLVFSQLAGVVSFDAGAVFLLEGHKLTCVHQTWAWPGLRPLEVPLREGPTGWAAAQAATLVNGNPLAEPGELGRLARIHQWRDALIVPLWNGGRVVGSLNLYATSPHGYGQDDGRLLELMTASLGITLAQAPSRKPPARAATARAAATHAS
jgi:putative nucleotidyltransferase with HDIG domain